MHKSFAIQSRQDIYAHYKTPSNRLSAKYLITYAKLYAENSLISPRSSGFFGPHPNQYIQCVMICTVQKRKIDRPCPAARSKMIFKIFRSIFTCTLYYCKAQCCGEKSLKVYLTWPANKAVPLILITNWSGENQSEETEVKNLENSCWHFLHFLAHNT